MSPICFQGGELVRLRESRDGVAAGCCGIVWGVYDLEKPLYEATFVDQDGKGVDVMFGDADVERLDDFVEVPFRERLMQIRQSLFPEQRVSGLESDEWV